MFDSGTHVTAQERHNGVAFEHFLDHAAFYLPFELTAVDVAASQESRINPVRLVAGLGVGSLVFTVSPDDVVRAQATAHFGLTFDISAPQTWWLDTRSLDEYGTSMLQVQLRRDDGAVLLEFDSAGELDAELHAPVEMAPGTHHFVVAAAIDSGAVANGDNNRAWGQLDVRFRRLLRSDLNCDGSLDTFDIDPLLLALLDWPHYAGPHRECMPSIAAIDPDGDGAITMLDIDPFVASLLGE